MRLTSSVRHPSYHSTLLLVNWGVSPKSTHTPSVLFYSRRADDRQRDLHNTFHCGSSALRLILILAERADIILLSPLHAVTAARRFCHAPDHA